MSTTSSKLSVPERDSGKKDAMCGVFFHTHLALGFHSPD